MGKVPVSGFCHAGHLCPPLNRKIESDIFQLGVILYQIMTGDLPYKNDDRPVWKEVKDRYDKGEFSSTSSLPAIEGIIAQCWEGKYQCVEAIKNDMKHTRGLSYLRLATLCIINTFSARHQQRKSDLSRLDIARRSPRTAIAFVGLVGGIIIVWKFLKRKR